MLTTHNPADLAHADAVAFLAAGRLLYRGEPGELASAFGVASIEEVYGIEAGDVPDAPALPPAAVPAHERSLAAQVRGSRRSAAVVAADPPLRRILTRNRLSAAVVVGSPIMIAAMFAMLFRPHAFDPANDNPGSSAMIMFWIAFGAFFFGLTYGLLQICTELAIVRRERRTVLRLRPCRFILRSSIFSTSYSCSPSIVIGGGGATTRSGKSSSEFS